jgi:lysophospholipase L1-like esterase
MSPLTRSAALQFALIASVAGACRAAADQRFCFGAGPAPQGYVRVLPGTPYSQAQGYGFEAGSDATVVDRGGDDSLRRQVLTGAHPFFFSVAVPEGNYTVAVLFGDPLGESPTTVKSELRRLEVEELHTQPGRFATRTFTVNVRTPAIAPDGVVLLKPREKTGEVWDWDERLTLEFNGEHPCVCSVTVAPAPLIPTVYLAGDSTVCDQPYEPFNSWGQMLPRFFGPGVAIANHAESGESLRSFISEKRLAKLDTLMRPGDYLMIQFGHNDMKERGDGVGAFTTYKADLERFVADARAHGTTPVLITSVSRRTFGPDGKIRNSFGDYLEAVRRVAREQGVALIDLNAKSVALYEALGPQGVKALFPTVHGTVEGTHHDNYGSYEVAKCIVEGIKENKLPLAGYLIGDTQPFDPSRPDPLGQFDVPASPRATTEVPYGK